MKLRVFTSVSYRNAKCPECGEVVEKVELMDPGQRITKRFAQYILRLCDLITIQEVARHLSLNWKTVKEIHKSSLRERLAKEDIGYTRILAVDEIAVKEGA